jgi:class 3 adenylate cyclase/CHASE2 domain-containing sensor protein
LLLAVRLSFLKSPTFFIAAPVIFVVCLLEWAQFPALQRLELMTYDWRARLAHNFHTTAPHAATNLALVEISDNAIYEVKHDRRLGFLYGLYWPRDVYAAGLKELTQEGAKVVGFDVLFDQARDDLAMVTLPDGSIAYPDDIFAAQLKQAGNVILAADHGLLPQEKFRSNAWRVGNIAVDSDADAVLRRSHAYQGYRVWDHVIEYAAAELQWNLPKTIDDRKKHIITFFSQLDGEPTVLPTDDEGRIAATNILNKPPPGIPDKIVPYKNFRAWAMGIQLAAYELKLDLDHPVFEPGRIILKSTNGLITRSIPVDDQDSFYIDWSLTANDRQVYQGAFENLLAAQVVRKQGEAVTNNAWKDKVVVIGSTATGNDLGDMGATPLENRTFLASEHLNVANSVISGRFVQKTPLALNLALIILVGVLSAWITWAVEKAYEGSLLIIAFAAFYVALCAGFYLAWRIWVPIILPLGCAGLVTHIGALVYRVRFEQSQKRKVKQLFSRLVSPDVVNEVLEGDTIQIGGQRREITVYFADMRGFTEFTDLMQEQAAEYVKEHDLKEAKAEAYFDAQAHETLETVSTYLGIVADVVKRHKGTLDKYIGDQVMAFWGAPLPDPQHALHAVRAAIEAQRAIAEFNQKRQKENTDREEQNEDHARKGLPLLGPLPVLSMGTGINTGMTIVGLMGSETHLVNYTAFGREVNLAARLEGVSGHGRIIIGEGTFLALQRDDPELAGLCLEWEPRAVKGFRTAVRIYEVVWQPPTGILQQPGENTNIRITKPSAAGGEAVKK